MDLAFAVFQAKACEPEVRQNRVFKGCCSKTSVLEQPHLFMREAQQTAGPNFEFCNKGFRRLKRARDRSGIRFLPGGIPPGNNFI
jgi:hypothetical protein